VVSHLLVIDPGLRTGLAFFKDGTPEWSLTSEPPHDLVTKMIEGLQDAHTTLEVVCEEGPVNHRRQAQACEPVERIVRHTAKIIHWVRPSEWKRHPSARIEDGDNPQSRHERDVLRIGRWFLATRASELVFSRAA
jgi:hypothetical protein